MKRALIAVTVVLAGFAAHADSKAPEVCQLKYNGVVTWSGVAQDENGSGFYTAARQIGMDQGRCVYAKVDQVSNSGRVYKSDGSLSSDYSGKKKNLSNSEADQAKQQAGGFCITVSCITLVDVNHPEREQGAQLPDAPVIVTTGSGSSD